MNNIYIKSFFTFFVCFIFLSNLAHSSESKVLLKPFTLAKIYKNESLKNVAMKVKLQLINAGYKIVGTYVPSESVNIFIVSNEKILAAASKSKHGGFGAAIRVSMTKVNAEVQVSHNNPTYLSVAYRMKQNFSDVRNNLAKTLGYTKDFGGKGIPANELGNYNYAFGLEGFSGFMELAEHKSHEMALASVEKGFSRKLKDMKKVYQINIPGKKQVVYGVSLKNKIDDQKFLNDKYVMNIIDSKKIRRSAHLPYEIMVADKRVITLHPHFRIAVNFPDLRMFGKHSFGKLMDLPYVYEEYFVQLAGGVWPVPEELD